jgi:hypothetical protein
MLERAVVDARPAVQHDDRGALAHRTSVGDECRPADVNKKPHIANRYAHDWTLSTATRDVACFPLATQVLLTALRPAHEVEDEDDEQHDHENPDHAITCPSDSEWQRFPLRRFAGLVSPSLPAPQTSRGSEIPVDAGELRIY